MGAPRPIIWWHFSGGVVPIFGKRAGTTVFVIAEEGHCLQVTSPRRLLLPLFEISGLIYETLLERMSSIVGELSPGFLYGVRNTFNQSITYGLCFSFEELVLDFPQGLRELTASECKTFHLPVWKEEPPYKGPRPTRFSRENVI